MTLDAAKREAQAQWNTDPCGAVTVEGIEKETLNFYREARRYRYEDYAPWFEKMVRFTEWTDKDVLEIGVGLGSDHFRFAKQNNRMTAIDLSCEHLRQTKIHLALEGLSTATVYGDAETLPFASESFDLVYSFGVLHHTPNTSQAISEAYRVLRPGGQALIGLYHRDSFFFLVWTIIVNGMLKGGLWRKGWGRLLSEIEHRSRPDSAIPLVKVYGRQQARKLFSSFKKVDITACHIQLEAFQSFVPVSRQKLEESLGWLGWYLVIRAWK